MQPTACSRPVAGSATLIRPGSPGRARAPCRAGRPLHIPRRGSGCDCAAARRMPKSRGKPSWASVVMTHLPVLPVILMRTSAPIAIVLPTQVFSTKESSAAPGRNQDIGPEIAAARTCHRDKRRPASPTWRWSGDGPGRNRRRWRRASPPRLPRHDAPRFSRSGQYSSRHGFSGAPQASGPRDRGRPRAAKTPAANHC